MAPQVAPRWWWETRDAVWGCVRSVWSAWSAAGGRGVAGGRHAAGGTRRAIDFIALLWAAGCERLLRGCWLSCLGGLLSCSGAPLDLLSLGYRVWAAMWCLLCDVCCVVAGRTLLLATVLATVLWTGGCRVVAGCCVSVVAGVVLLLAAVLAAVGWLGARSCGGCVACVVRRAAGLSGLVGERLSLAGRGVVFAGCYGRCRCQRFTQIRADMGPYLI
ncbi:hypothetical protein B0T26DRAFT_729946 [Lasiosphaeria miniovina]|uniref:Uncharacterized protein n=1 Tax=Lasiosphaeria miniovina TaxID=1954250 RepID=A0AA39ZT46_9PEZI|nr:uncharacterized protein B0T26DRAFT_729946 [Lasiosphaeria miniovina]KAK0703150.1 hypothetical protein B0T26DRAFT_729946 [Lasiosphaeria miniovina]